LPTLRAIFDTNLYLNFLLSFQPERTAVGVIEAAALDLFDLLLPEDVVTELRDVVRRKPNVATRVSQERLDRFLSQLQVSATTLPLLEREPPAVLRDANDNYLLAVAVLFGADFLVTRDRDLLDLGEIAGVKVVDPATFLKVLQAETELLQG
jgi:uncharacterized protein